VSKTFNFSTASSDFRLSLSNPPLFPRKVGGSKFEVAGFVAGCRHLMRTLPSQQKRTNNSFTTVAVLLHQSRHKYLYLRAGNFTYNTEKEMNCGIHKYNTELFKY